MTNTTSTNVLQNLSSLHFSMSPNLYSFRHLSTLDKWLVFSNGTFPYPSMPNLKSRNPITSDPIKQIESKIFSKLLLAGQSFLQGASSYLQACWNTVTTFANENPSAFMVVICSAAMLLTTMSIFVIAGSKIKNLKQDLQNANEDIQALQNQVKNEQDKVKNEQEKNANLQNQVETTEQNLTKADEQIKSLEDQAAQDKNSIENLKGEVAKKEEKIQDQEKELGDKKKQIDGLKGAITIMNEQFNGTVKAFVSMAPDSSIMQQMGQQQSKIVEQGLEILNQKNKIEELNKEIAKLKQELENKNGNK